MSGLEVSRSIRRPRSPGWHRRARRARSKARQRCRKAKGSAADLALLRSHHGSMAPKPAPKSTGKGTKITGGDTPKTPKSHVEFGLPPAVVTSLQAITSRATQGLWHSEQPLTGEVTAEQQAQRRANLVRTLSRRITGNVKAKTELKEALHQWFIQLSQHLQGLITRIAAIGSKIDEDLQVACEDMLAGLEARSSLSTADQISHARSSLGPVLQPPQETAILELAAGLRALGTVTMSVMPGAHALPASTGPVGHLPAGPATPHGSVGAATSEASFGAGIMDVAEDVHMRGSETAAGTPRPTRWKRRSGGQAHRPSKSPRRDNPPGTPWPYIATGLTPEYTRPAASTEVADDAPLSHAGDDQPCLDWPAAWAKLAAFAAENGTELVGELCVSPEQEAAIPLVHNAAVEEETIATSNEAWAAVLAFVGTPNPALVPALCGRMQDVINRLRVCPSALPRVRQGLVLLAQATLGNVLDPFSFAPATCQEWLYPATLLEHGTPLRGYLASSSSSSAVVRVLLSQGCPMARIGEDEADLGELL